jgi:tetratricopeptide (TPR) repeat protein
MITEVAAAMHAADPSLSATEVAEALWLARFVPPTTGPPLKTPQATESAPARAAPALTTPVPSPQGGLDPTEHRSVLDVPAGLFLAGTPSHQAAGVQTRAPAVPALPHLLEMYRALRPLRRRVTMAAAGELDEVATAQASAEAGRPVPRFHPAAARWLDVALVIDDSPSMVVWRKTVAEARALMEGLGAFRNVATWTIDSGADGIQPARLRSGLGRIGRVCDYRELTTPSRRRLVLVFSDCIGPIWRRGEIHLWLDAWGRTMPTAIVQPLPLRLWDRCALDPMRVRIHARRPGAPNREMHVVPRDRTLHPRGAAVPVMELEPRWLAPWARMIAGGTTMSGTAIFPRWSPLMRSRTVRLLRPDAADDPVSVLARFRATASPETLELARYLSAAPLSLPVMRLVQSVMLPRSRPRHLAELFLSDLLVRDPGYRATADPEAVVYDFRPGVREILAGSLGARTALQILRRVSDFIGPRFGASLNFPAILSGLDIPDQIDEASRPFAEVACRLLDQIGGRYRELAKRLASALPPEHRPLPGRGDPFAIHRPGAAIRGPGGGTVTKPQPRDVDQEPAATAAVWGGVPPRNPNFTGRADLLADLRQQLTSKVTALLPHTLHGLGGVGKTQLAVEYAYQYAREYDLIWWIPSEQAALIRQAVVQLAPKLKIPVAQGDDFDQTLTAINDALRSRRDFPRWLLVFDNAIDPASLEPFLSNSNGHVLITSRNRNWATVAQMIEVDVFERSESVELLRRRLPQINDRDADTLADRLGDLPLALEQAAAWQATTAMPADRYIELLDQQLSALMSEEKPLDYPLPVAQAWGIAFQELTERAPAALQMLELSAFLGSEPISVRLLRNGRLIADRLPEPLRTAVREEISLHRAIRDIDRYGLAKIDPSRHSMQVHRLVQAVLRDRMSGEQQEMYLQSVQALLAAANPGDPDDEQTWGRHAELSPHLVPARLVESQSNEVRRVVLDQIRYRWVQGDYLGSRELAEIAVERWRHVFGDEDQYTLDGGRLLAIALRSLGAIAESRELTATLYQRARTALGDDHEHTLSIGNSRGADLRLLGQWQIAYELDSGLLELHRQVYGVEDRATFRAANNLAVDLRLLGQFKAAREIDEENDAGLARVLGQDHPDRLRSVSNLSRDLYGLGLYEQAVQLQRDSLPVVRRVLGEDHAEVLKATRIHIATLRKIGLIIEAHEMAHLLVAQSRRRLGDGHPDTVCSMMTLSNCMAAVGEVERARYVGEDAVVAFRQQLGPDHPFTLAAITNVATVLRLLIEHPTARANDEIAVAGFERSLGPDHLYTYCAEMNYANDLAVVGDHAGALVRTRHALGGFERIFTDSHPQVVVCRNNLSIDLEETGAYAEARQLRHVLPQQYRAVFGPTHPETQLMELRRRASIEIEPPNW